MLVGVVSLGCQWVRETEVLSQCRACSSGFCLKSNHLTFTPYALLQVLADAQLRPGVTGKTVNGVYTGKQPEAEAVAQREPAVV